MFNLSSRLFVSLRSLQLLRVGLDLGILLGGCLQAIHGRDHGEAHEDIGSRELTTAEVRSTTRGGLQLLLEEAEVIVKVPVEEGGFHLGSYGTRERPDEERRGISDHFRLLGRGTWQKFK